MTKSKVGIIAGNFDIIHPGYVHMFKECKEYCDELIVLLHEDPSIERPEKLKPILTMDERVLVLTSLRYIDRVVSYKTEVDLYNTIIQLQPNIRFLGDDYRLKPFTGDNLPIPIHYLDRSHGWSTTKFKTRIYESLKK